jgi:hypothetical protein
MKLTNDQANLLRFLQKYPNQWHSYQSDHKTLKAVIGLSERNSNLKLDRELKQMYFQTEFTGFLKPLSF